MEIAEKNCCLRACDDQDQEHEKQETEHVIHLVWPQRIEDEEQLNKDAT